MSVSDTKKLKAAAAMADVREVQAMLRLWDPIGVEPGTVAPADEYDSYAPHIVSMVRGGCSREKLAAHLEYLGSEVMGLGASNEASLTHSAKFAANIMDRLLSPSTPLERTRER